MIVDHLGYVVLNSPQYNIKTYGASPLNADNLSEINSAINSPYRVVIIGDSIDEIFIHSQTIEGISNKSYIINGELKIADGVIKDLEADALIGATELTITNASNFFKTGDHVCITSTARDVQGGGNAKDRREGQPFIITVDGNTITLDSPCVFDYLTSQGAKIGHTQSNINFFDKTKFIVDGFGTINNNWETMLNVEPNSSLMEQKQGYQHGACMMTDSCTYFEIRNIKVVDGLVYGLGIFYNNKHFVVDALRTDGIHDKSIILYGFGSDINEYWEIKNCVIENSPYEDGIACYTQSRYGLIEGNTIKNCSRFGILLNPTISHVVVKNNTVTDCGQPLFVGNSTITFEGKNILEGYGYYKRTSATKRASVLVTNANNGKMSGIEISQVTKTAPLLSLVDANGWEFDSMLLASTNVEALKMSSSSPMTATLKNSTLRGNGTNYSLDANSTLIKENVKEE